MPRWTLLSPMVAAAVLALVSLLTVGPGLALVLAVVSAVALVLAVLAAVHHAEVVAHRIGEPFGTLVLAVAITVIEVALIVSLMVTGGAQKDALPRDTVFATIMIICNGVVGLCLLVGGLRHYEQQFRVEGAISALAYLIALATLSLVWTDLHRGAAGVCRGRVARVVGGLRIRADRAPSRLLSAGARRR